MINSTFAPVDWMIFGSYFLLLFITSIALSRVKVKTTRDYFVGANSMPIFAVAISVLATSQSAATFLGGPEYSYSKDLTFLGFYLSAFIAVIIVAYLLIPRFYAIRAVTVYELLEIRYGKRAKMEAGVMFLIGRLFASGARLYIGALAISMILFMDISPLHLALSISILMLGALGYTYFGGIKSVIFSDIIQAITYIGSAIALLVYLFYSMDISLDGMLKILSDEGKLTLIDSSFNSFEGGFNIYTIFMGWLLLNIGAYGLDQDMTQRVLSCKNSKEGAKSLIYSILMTIPVASLFLLIGLLLYLYYQHPELSGFEGSIDREFDGDKITILMSYILNEMPDGLRGLVTVGAIAAALSSTNSVLGAMSSVAIEDLYRPWRLNRGEASEAHFLRASKIGVVVFAILLSSMAMLSYYWQHATQTHLLNFALGVMAFAYAGLLGVYGVAIFTTRGSGKMVVWALLGGFMTVLLLQSYVLALFDITLKVGFSWQLVLGTMVSAMIMMIGRGR
jgi:SSS family transporter